MTAGREVHAHDPVAQLAHGHVDGRVRLRPGVRLDVHVLGAEKPLGSIDRERLDLVDHLACAAVIATARVALGIFVGEQRAEGLEDGGAREVLGGDELESFRLPLVLLSDQVGDLRIVAIQRPEGHRGDGGGHIRNRTCYPARGGGGPRRCAVEIAPSRRTCGSGPVRSRTLEATPPGAGPPSRITTTPVSDAASAAFIAGSLPWRFALVVMSGPAARRSSSVTSCLGIRTPSVPPPLAWRMTVSGPGQKRRMKSSARASTCTQPSSCDSAAAIRISGRPTGRPLMAKIRRQATSSSAAAPSP